MKRLIFAAAVAGLMHPAHAQNIIKCGEIISEMNNYSDYIQELSSKYFRARQELIQYVSGNERSKFAYTLIIRRVDSNKDFIDLSSKAVGGWIGQARSYQCADQNTLDSMERFIAQMFLRVRDEHRKTLPPLPEPNW